MGSDMSERSTGIVEISDVQPDVLQMLCEFAYTGNIKGKAWAAENTVCELLRAASKYEIPSLERLCADQVQRMTTIENAADRLTVATQINAGELKSHCLQFIADHLRQVKNTEGWARLMQDKQMLCEIAPLLFDTMSSPTKRPRTEEK